MNTNFLARTQLFSGIYPDEISSLLSCLHAREAAFKKGETIFHADSEIEEIGLILSGSVNMIVNLYWGSSRIFGHMNPGDIFGENYAAIEGKKLPGDLVAAQESRVLFLNLKQVYTTCRKSCPYHHQLIENLLRLSAQKNLMLSERMLHTSSRTIRDRVLSYLSAMARESGSSHFKIPFNRQQMADYLGVERSALSAELSKMKKEGLIAFQKNEFSLSSPAVYHE